jgi:hypothetical protein
LGKSFRGNILRQQNLLGSIELPMAKRSDKAEPATDPHKDQQINLRLHPDLLAAVDRYADKQRRSRNMAIVLAIEEVLARAGLWPPPGDSADA